MFNIIIADKNANHEIIDTLNNISLQKRGEVGEIKVVVYEINFHRELHDILETNAELNEMVHVIPAEGMKVVECYEAALRNIKEGYVQFMKPGSLMVPKLYSKIMELKQPQDIILVPSLSDEGAVKKKWRGKSLQDITLEDIDYGIPYFFGAIINSSIIKNKTFNKKLHNYKREEFILRYLLEAQKYTVFTQPGIYTPGIWNTNSGSFPGATKKSWYIEGLKELILPIMEKYQREGKPVPMVLQGFTFTLILSQFKYNLNLKDKHIFSTEKAFKEYQELISKALSNIEDSIILNAEARDEYFATNPLKLCLLRLKYGDDYKPEFIYGHKGKDVLITAGRYGIVNFSAQKVSIDLMEFRGDKLIIEASIVGILPKEDYEIRCFLNGEDIPVEETYRYAHTKYFGISVHKRNTFRVEISREVLEGKQNNYLRFSAFIKNYEIPLFLEGKRYTAKIPSTVPRGYWYSKGFLLSYKRDEDGLLIQRRTIPGHIKKELIYLTSLLRGGKKRAFLIRLSYWATRPFYARKNIWMTYDKMYKGGDCGEYFYKYILSRNNPCIDAQYIINYDYPDAKRLMEEGYSPLKYRSLKQRLYFLNSSIVATTHANIPVFSGMIPACFACLQDLFNAEVVCIQHGLAVQQLAHNCNQLYDNLKRFYCASPHEIENLSKPIYAFPEGALKLTGIPRYDGLKSRDKKEILITPTWRSYIAMPASLGNVRPYADSFKKTDYFKIYNSLISDEKLIACARKNGYKLVYLLHPTISSQIKDYKVSEGVEIRSAVGINYETILTESSLMVTDYSGVQFDFAYMRKPVVYYHPPKLPPHYAEGGFFYDTMGFGEICTTHEELVDTLCAYMDRQCTMDPFYKKREDDFFAYQDLNSCERIYHDLVDYQNSLNNSIT